MGSGHKTWPVSITDHRQRKKSTLESQSWRGLEVFVEGGNSADDDGHLRNNTLLCRSKTILQHNMSRRINKALQNNIMEALTVLIGTGWRAMEQLIEMERNEIAGPLSKNRSQRCLCAFRRSQAVRCNPKATSNLRIDMLKAIGRQHIHQ